jgi:hypothetical protein
MGGFGSGRRQRYQRRTTEGYLALDISVLRRRGLLQPGRSGTIAWSREGARLGSASLFAESGSLRLSYQTTTSEGSAERIDERIEIWSTQTSLGGQRQWFRCPGCHRQCRIRYGGPRFRCRLCHGLSYESQFESRAQRANRRARKIRRRLGGSDCLMEEFPPRPRGIALGNLSTPRSSGGGRGS